MYHENIGYLDGFRGHGNEFPLSASGNVFCVRSIVLEQVFSNIHLHFLVCRVLRWLPLCESFGILLLNHLKDVLDTVAILHIEFCLLIRIC